MKFEVAVLLICCLQCVFSDCLFEVWGRCVHIRKGSVGKEKKTKTSLPCNFELFDQNRDGVINREEFALKSSGMDKTKLQTLFDTVDKNKDKVISSTEYKDGIKHLHDQGLLGTCH
nr:uncharacterized protein LOC117691000 [Crassostrea gigas]